MTFRALIVLPLVALCACTTTIRKHPEFGARLNSVKKIGVMPTQASVVKIVFTGDNETLDESAADAKTQTESEVLSQIRQRDFTVEMVPLDNAMLETLPDLRFTATQVQKAHDLAMTELYSPEGWMKDSAFSVQRSLGPEVNQVADVVNADALLFATYSGFEKSGGEIAKDVAVTVLVLVATLGRVAVTQPWDSAVVQVCLVDAATGEVLYANRVRTESMFSDNAAELTRAALEDLKRD